MKAYNTQTTRTLPFSDYLSLPGFSHSFLKSGGATITPTAKMNFGTMVHNYLLEPDKFDYTNIKTVRPAAIALMKVLGSSYRFLENELSVQADFVHEGFIMPYKGRIDSTIYSKLVIDYKVSDIPLEKSVDFFGYINPMSGYCLATGCNRAMIIRVCPKSFSTQVGEIPINYSFWEKKVKQYGEPIL